MASAASRNGNMMNCTLAPEVPEVPPVQPVPAAFNDCPVGQDTQLSPDIYWSVGQVAEQVLDPSELETRYIPELHDKQLVVVLSHVAQVREQLSQTPLTSTVVPCGQEAMQVVPDLTKPVAHEVQVLVVVTQVAQVESQLVQVLAAVS